jgi:hypothetical protein
MLFWFLAAVATAVLFVIADDVVRTRLGHDTILGVILRRRALRRAYVDAQRFAAGVEPKRRGLVLRGGR